jgi:hypothetical protein
MKFLAKSDANNFSEPEVRPNRNLMAIIGRFLAIVKYPICGIIKSEARS